MKEYIDSEILKALQRERRPRSSAWLRQRTGIPQTRISAALYRLHRLGHVSRRNGLWVAEIAVVNGGERLREDDALDWITSGIQDSRQKFGAENVKSNAQDQTVGGTLGERWRSFRKLCLYYAECVRLDERPHISAWQNRRGDSWLPLGSRLDWNALGSGAPITIPSTPALEEFARRQATARGAPQLAIGLAIDIFKVKDDDGEGNPLRSLTPLLVVRVWPEIGNGVVSLRPLARPELNNRWLFTRFKSRESRQELIESLGILPAAAVAQADDDDNEAPDLFIIPGIGTTINQLFERTQQHWREYGGIPSLRSDPPLEEITECGIYNRVILLAIPELKYAKRLHGELYRIATSASDEDLDRTALRMMFPHEPPVDSECEFETKQRELFEPDLLNEDQSVAATTALRAPLVVVTGPPGTGKSTVVQAVCANIALHGEAGLFASRNHQGLEAVEPKVNAFVEPEKLMLRPVYPYSEKSKRFDWQRVMVSLLCRPHRRTIVAERESAMTTLRGTLQEVLRDEQQCRDLLELRDRLAGRLNEAIELRRGLSRDLEDLPRADLGELTVHKVARLGRWWQALNRLPKFVRVLASPLLQIWSRWRLASIARATGSRLVREALNSAARAAGRDRLGRLLASWVDLRAVLQAEFRTEELEAEIKRLPALAELQESIDRQRALLGTQVRDALRLIAESAGSGITPEAREEFAQLRAGLDNLGGDLSSDDPFVQRLARAFGKLMPELMKHFPLWAVSNLSVSKVMPLAPGMFDIAVIDEASQCDIPSVIPILYRARRSMIVGDPMQLPHVTQLSREADLYVRRRCGVEDFDFESFTFRANSVFDLASTRSKANRIELRSHYRCHPDIAAYCNDAFYNKTLWVRTSDRSLADRLGYRVEPRGCTWTHVEADIVAASRGCYCENQIDAVLNQLNTLQDNGFNGTVGVVTPFRAHADKIRNCVHARVVKQTLDRWRFLVDTADGFQGDERDLMLFSLVGGPGMPDGSLGFLRNSPNRFNVAVSRARVILHVLGDENWAAGCEISYIQDLLQRCQRPRASSGRHVREDLIGPVWEPRLAQALRDEDLPVEQQYEAGGYYLDIALLTNKLMLDVEVDGERHHRDPATGDRRLDDIYRDMVLRALGWNIMRFWVYELREDFDECVRQIKSTYLKFRE
jgi:very-short-patch-repair endonuclease/adenylate kinase family enzyme